MRCRLEPMADPADRAAAPPPRFSAWACALGLARTLRPQQWVKNLFVLAPVVFAKHLTHPSVIKGALGAFGIFCLLSGAVYALNDLVDAEADRSHPIKRRRPIAAGVVPAALARVAVVGLALVALGGSLLGPRYFTALAGGYFVLNVAYSLRLKRVAYLDVASIAAGFVLRVLAGGAAIRTPVSGYMIACTALLALFLGFGKRRHELLSVGASARRVVLRAYSAGVLLVALLVTGTGAVGAYLAYCLDPDTQRLLAFGWLWVTAVHPAFGVARFLQLAGSRPEAESPTQEMLRDTPFMLNLFLWAVEVVAVVYRLRPT
ncbi:MAG: UbiA prenyltransferase family protein [Deltaproteobacteria bacterium]|nr:UbiA prenyltransferase family protein [Deltaproteobacteria bacterium]